jgi:hypothetical protein
MRALAERAGLRGGLLLLLKLMQHPLEEVLGAADAHILINTVSTDTLGGVRTFPYTRGFFIAGFTSVFLVCVSLSLFYLVQFALDDVPLVFEVLDLL